MNEETFYKIKLDLVHNTINNFVHVMQYDDGVAYIRAEIYKDWQHVYPSEEFDSAELRLKKHDGAWIKCNSVEPYIPVAKPPYAEAKEAGVYYYYQNGNYILVTSSMTEQTYDSLDPNLFYKNVGTIISLEHDYVKINVVEELTDIPGGCPAVIDLYSTDGHIQTAKFVLDVDRNPIQTGEAVKNVPEDVSAKLSEMSKGIANTVKVTPQTLTDEEKAQARENIGVGASDINIENGTGTNSIQQKESSKGFEFDNPNYTPTVDTSFGAKGKDSTVLNGNSMAYGELSTAEGRSTLAVGIRSHAEGTKTVSANSNAHAEGLQSVASGEHSHAEGHQSVASGFSAHAQNSQTKATGEDSTAIGYQSQATGLASFSQGTRTKATSANAVAMGADSVSNGYASIASGISTKSGFTSRYWVDYTQTERGSKTIQTDGTITVISAICDKGYAIYTEVNNKTISYRISPVPTSTNKVLFQIIYAISGSTPQPPAPPVDVPDNTATYAEGYNTEAFLFGSHAQNINTRAIGKGTTAEGYNTTAFGDFSNACGQDTFARGTSSFAQGYKSESFGNSSVALNIGTYAANDGQTVVGTYNEKTNNAVFIVGNGTSDQYRHNAFVVYQDGHAEVKEQGTTDKSVAQVKFVKDTLNSYLPQIRLSSSQTTRPMSRVVHDTYTEHKITFQLTAEQAGYIEDNSKPVVKLQLSQHIQYIDGDYLYLQRNVIQTLAEREVIQFTFNNARFNFDEALTQGYVPMTEIGDGAAIYDKSTKTLFVSFVETSPKKVEDALSGGGGGSQLYLHILENEDGLAPCAVITFRRDSYLKGDLRTSSWGAAIADDSLAIKVSQYLNDAYTAPFEYGNFYNSFYCRFHADAGEIVACMTDGQDVDPYYPVTSDIVYKINDDGTVTAL